MPVYRLTTFGGVSLLRDGEPFAGAVAQRQRLALLALVARYGARGIARDRVMSILWPGDSSTDARHSLDQAISATRIPDGARLVDGVATLRLNAEAVSSDVGEFDEASRDAPERAIELYAGPFLAGFAPRNGEAFERWAAVERAQLNRAYAGCLEALARRAAQGGDLAARAHWLGRLATEVLSDDVALQYLEALLAIDDRARALQFSRTYEHRVREELHTEVSREVRDLVRRIREQQPTELPAEGVTPRHGPPEPAAPSAPDRLRTLLGRAMRGRYDVGRVVSDEATLVRFAAFDRQGGAAVEVCALRPEVAAFADRGVFADVFGRVMARPHPGLAPVTDVGATADAVYYVTRATQGEPLRERLGRERPLRIPEAVQIARDLAAALAAAHSTRVAHLDVRPKHVTLATRGAVLARLGVAAALTAGPAGRSSGGDSPRSAMIMLGDPVYLSPEQIAGNVAPDERSDVYALGGLLFELLAGEPPHGTGALLPLRKATLPAQSVLDVRARVPDALAEVVSRCLERVPADRYQSASELLTALASVPI
jgi:DNA-binding SARP family transcriptional activator